MSNVGLSPSMIKTEPARKKWQRRDDDNLQISTLMEMTTRRKSGTVALLISESVDSGRTSLAGQF